MASSKYSDKLFKINHKQGSLELNKDEARQIKAYRDIIERDKGGRIKGDHDGRKKLFAFRELYYVYIMADPFTMYSVLNDERRHKQALETSYLKEFPDWKPDASIFEAMKQYKEDTRLSPIGYAFVNARKALYNIGQDIELFNTMNEELRIDIAQTRGELLDTNITEEDKQKLQLRLESNIKELSTNNKEILEITSTLPKRLDSLEQLKTKLSEEDNELEAVVGGGMVFSREG